MPYSITTKDGITIRNIPDSVPQDSVELRARVDRIRRGDESGAPSNVAQIPTGTDRPAPAADGSIRPETNAGIVDTAIGTGEAALSAATGATGGAVGMIGGTLKGLAEQILSGQFGTPEAAKLVEQSAMKGAQALTYEPRTASGQDQAAAMGSAMQQVLPVAAIMPSLVPAAAGARSAAPAGVVARAGAEGLGRAVAGEAGAAAMSSGIDAGSRVAQLAASKATTLPRRALEALSREPEARPTPGTRGSMGAAGTDMATQRRMTAENMGLTGDRALTRGQATRDPAQLKFEVETAKMQNEGAPLRDRRTAQNEQFAKNFDSYVDMTGAEATSLRGTGVLVDKALRDQAAKDKAQIRVAYKNAEKAGEMEAPVSLVSLVDYLNEVAPESATAPILTTARNLAIEQGIAREQGGRLVPATTRSADSLMNRPAVSGVKLKDAERYRQAINRNIGFEDTNVRQGTIIKGLIDEATDGMGGDLYRQARATRQRFAQNYEDRAVIAKLVKSKKGMADRQVALEDVFSHSVLKGSLDDVRNVRRVLQRSGPEGQQAWKELQGATARHIRDEAFKNTATDGLGNRVISPKGLDDVIRNLDADGKLEFVFGKKGAQTMRDANDLVKYAQTVPPEAAINTSNTAATMAMLTTADSMLSVMLGVPAPVSTVSRLTLSHIKDAKLRRRINDALNDMQSKPPRAPGPAAVSPPAPQPTIH